MNIYYSIDAKDPDALALRAVKVDTTDLNATPSNIDCGNYNVRTGQAMIRNPYSQYIGGSVTIRDSDSVLVALTVESIPILGYFAQSQYDTWLALT